MPTAVRIWERRTVAGWREFLTVCVKRVPKTCADRQNRIVREMGLAPAPGITKWVIPSPNSGVAQMAEQTRTIG